MSHPLANHPIAVAAAATVGLYGLNKVKITRGVAYVRQVESTSDGYVLVEMSDDRVFVADTEHLHSIHAAYQTRTEVRYWVNNFLRVYGVPRGSLGDPSIMSRFF